MWFSTHFLSQPVHCLSTEIRSLSAHPILSLPRNHAFTIKTSVSYLEKSLSTSKLLISALEIHRHFVAFSCPPFCLLFFKALLTFKCMTEHLFADFSYSIALDTYLWKQMMKMNRKLIHIWYNLDKRHLLFTKRKCHKFSWLFMASLVLPEEDRFAHAE